MTNQVDIDYFITALAKPQMLYRFHHALANQSHRTSAQKKASERIRDEACMDIEDLIFGYRKGHS